MNLKIIILGDPKTKKNSQQIFINSRTGKPFITQSKIYKQYRNDFLKQVTGNMKKNIDTPVKIKCTYYRKTKRKVDLVNLLNATNDLLVEAGVIEDDNSNIVSSHDGSVVLHDKNNPRVEIEIKGQQWSKGEIMNQVILIGRLTADPELRFAQSGKAVCNFRLAVDRPFSKEKKTDFFKVVVWDKQGEAVDKYMKKGSQIAVNGSVQIEQYTDKEGNARYSTDIVANQVEFLGSPGGKSKREDSGYVDKDTNFPKVEDEDIPF